MKTEKYADKEKVPQWIKDQIIAAEIRKLLADRIYIEEESPNEKYNLTSRQHNHCYEAESKFVGGIKEPTTLDGPTKLKPAAKKLRSGQIKAREPIVPKSVFEYTVMKTKGELVTIGTVFNSNVKYIRVDYPGLPDQYCIASNVVKNLIHESISKGYCGMQSTLNGEKFVALIEIDKSSLIKCSSL